MLGKAHRSTLFRPRPRGLTSVGLAAAAAFVCLLAVAVLPRRSPERLPAETPDNDPTGELVIFHAGSLAVPFREVSASFNEMFPHVTIRAEAAGSRDTARKVSDLGRHCDVLGTADYRVIDSLLIPEHADFNIRFATNEMVIAYTDRSTDAGVITAVNWPALLLEDGVAFGRADPNRDPCGYRTVMLFQLAEQHYRLPHLARRLESKHGRKYVRPKETDLLALLEAGEIDFLFIYRSVAMQHGLRWIALPDEVNLGSAALAGIYATASVEITGKKPGTYIRRTGARMVYGVTIPKSCENRELALAWVGHLLSRTGRAVMQRNGQPVVAPALTAQYDAVPETLKPFCSRLADID